MVHWPGADLAAFSGRSHWRSHAERERRRCAACGNRHLCGGASRNAPLAWDGLGRGPFRWDDLHARSPSHQSWNNTAVSDAPIGKGGTMNTKKLALVALLVSIVSPVSQAQIKHIEMRVE